jgi:hypothetical protein
MEGTKVRVKSGSRFAGHLKADWANLYPFRAAQV